MYIGIILGYVFGVFIGGKSEGERGRIHFEWFLQKTRLHIHHWIVFLLLLILYMYIYGSMDIISGFFIGGIIHGLTYNDWYKIIEPPVNSL